MSDIPKISDSSELINEIVDANASDTDIMTALQNAIAHRDSCTKTGCPLCAVFRKHEQKRREERFSRGRKIRIDETLSLRFLLSGERGERRRFEHTLVLGSRAFRIEKIEMDVSLRDRGEEDGGAVTISDWVRGDEPHDTRLVSQPASFFAPNPLGSGYLFATLKDKDTLGFTASFKEPATLSVAFYGRLGTRRGQ